VVNAEQLQRLGIGLEWVPALNDTFAKFGIATVNQQAAFIGQCAHECNHFKTLQENLNYKAQTLFEKFHKYFPTMELATQYAHNPAKIANRAYANRCGNRDEASGDGWRFHGRGCIQLTFHDNYWHCGQAAGVDFVANPDLVAQPKYAALSAGWFWSTHGCNALADARDWMGLTKKINGGTFGLDERVGLIKQAISVLT
jgi:putative chitinase